MADVFISYKRERRDHAQRLAVVLEAYGFDVWWDYELIVGPNYTAQLEQQIASAKSLIVLWCSGSRESKFVQDEARLAQRANKLLPARLEQVEPPVGFGMDQSASLIGWTGAPDHAGIDGLVKGVERLAATARQPRQNTLAVLVQLPPLPPLQLVEANKPDTNSPAASASLQNEAPPSSAISNELDEVAVEFREWIARREANDEEWNDVLGVIARTLLERSKVAQSVALDIRPWGNKIIVDAFLPRFTRPRRIILASIGGYENYPGYQLEFYSDAPGIEVTYERVRWMLAKDGSRLLARLVPGNRQRAYSAKSYGEHLWSVIQKI